MREMDAKEARKKVLEKHGPKSLQIALDVIKEAVNKGETNCVVSTFPSRTVTDFVMGELRKQKFRVKKGITVSTFTIHW